MLEHRYHTQAVDGVVEDLGELRRGIRVAHALEALPRLRLRRLNEVDQSGSVERAVTMLHVAAVDHLIGAVLDVEERVFIIALEKTARRRAEGRLNVFFEVAFLSLNRHWTSPPSSSASSLSIGGRAASSSLDISSDVLYVATPMGLL